MKLLSVLLFVISCICHLTFAWDYVTFAQQWPQSSCKQLKKTSPHKNCNLPTKGKWTIHGVWPSNRDYQNDGKCMGEKFDMSKIRPIINDLEKFWPSIFSDSSNRFWGHEWNSHGRCGGDIPGLDSMYNYFKKGLDLHKQYDIEKILSRHQIKPNNHKTVPVQKIIDAIRADTGGIPKIKCIDNVILNEILICMNSNDMQIQHCGGRTNCKKDVYYLEYWGDMPANKDEDVQSNVIETSGSNIIGLSIIIGILAIFLFKNT